MATIELPRVHVESVTLITSATRPLLINRDPPPGETGVPLDSPLALRAGEPHDSVRAERTVIFDGRVRLPGGLALLHRLFVALVADQVSGVEDEATSARPERRDTETEGEQTACDRGVHGFTFTAPWMFTFTRSSQWPPMEMPPALGGSATQTYPSPGGSSQCPATHS